MGRGIVGRARLRTVAPVLAGAAVVASGCFYGPDQSLTYVELATKAKAENITPWFCQSGGVGGAMEDGKGSADGLANPLYEGKKKGTLSDADCLALAQFFDKAKAAAMKYPTRGDAKKALTADGKPAFRQSVQFVPGLGTHDSIAGVTSTGIDPEHPFFYQYDGEGDDARLAGLSWGVFSAGPPEGFPGSNDWWHTHSSLCYKKNTVPPEVVGNEISDQECEKRGGSNRALSFNGATLWMGHAWILPGYEDTFDVFSGAYMCVRGTGPVTDEKDPCKSDRSDPEHGHGGHGGDAHGAPAPAPAPTTTSAATKPATDHGDHTH